MANFVSINFIYLRKINYLTQKELADKYGKKPTSISSYERELSLPPVDLLQEVCKDYGYSIDDFVNKDLSKIASEDYVNVPTLSIGEKTIESLQLLVETKDKIIAEKNIIIEVKNDAVKAANKSVERMEVILNQNFKQVEGIDTLNDLLATILLNSGIEIADKKLKEYLKKQ